MGYTYESGIQSPISGIIKKEFPISQYDSLTSLSVPLVFLPILLFSSFIRNLVLANIEEDMKLDEDRILRARALMENGLKIELWIIIRPLPPRGDGFLRRKPTFSTNIKRQTIFSLLTTSH